MTSASQDTVSLELLATRLTQNLRRMYCAAQRIMVEPTLDRRLPYEEHRQDADRAIRALVSQLQLVATAEEKPSIIAFSRAFLTFSELNATITSNALLAETPTETAAARELAAGDGQRAFGQVQAALSRLIASLGETTPSPEAVQAAIGFPAIGTTWRTKGISDTETWTERFTVLPNRTYNGRPVHQVGGDMWTFLLDRATRNPVALLRQGIERFAFSPYEPQYTFPLWVGKFWLSTYTISDYERGQTYSDVLWRGKVTAYEDVIVPAGTFKVFKLEGSNVVTRRDWWYAPELKMNVKWSVERLSDHPYGPGKRTWELIEVVQ